LTPPLPPVMVRPEFNVKDSADVWAPKLLPPWVPKVTFPEPLTAPAELLI